MTGQRREETLTFTPAAWDAVGPLLEKTAILAPLSEVLNNIVEYGETDEEMENKDKRAAEARSQYANCDGTAGTAIYEYMRSLRL